MPHPVRPQLHAQTQKGPASDPQQVLDAAYKFTISQSKPEQCPHDFVIQYPCPQDPLIYQTFISRREIARLEEGKAQPPIPVPPLGSRPAAVLIETCLLGRRPVIPYRADSPSPILGVTPAFESEREKFIGRPKLSKFKQIQPLLDSLPGFRTLHLLINFTGFEGHKSWMSLTTGFISDDEMVRGQFLRSHESFCQMFSFTSRWQVDIFMSEVAFSVHALVDGYQWLVVAPLHICHIIQMWSVECNGDQPALIRMHPNLTEAFADLALALASSHEMVFLSPERIPESQSGLSGIGNNSFHPSAFPNDLPSGPSEGFFSPVSMLVASPEFDNDDSSMHRKFSVIFTDFGNSPVRLHRCEGRQELSNFSPSGYSFVIPFHETDCQCKDTLVHDLMLAMPYYCWPCPALSSKQVVALMEPSHADRSIPALTYTESDPISQIPLASGGIA